MLPTSSHASPPPLNTTTGSANVSGLRATEVTMKPTAVRQGDGGPVLADALHNAHNHLLQGLALQLLAAMTPRNLKEKKIITTNCKSITIINIHEVLIGGAN